MGTRSAMMPRRGLERATNAVETTMPRLHMELPVNGSPRNEAESPRDSWKRKTK